ncbi:MAG: DNA translocase FtsK [Bacteroidia bacterium]
MAKNTSRQKKPVKKASGPGALTLAIKWIEDLRYNPEKQAKARRLGGWTLVFLAMISLVACISYYFTGHADQTEGVGEVGNWLGFVGSRLAEYIILRGFGIFGFVIVLYALLLGLVLLEDDYYLYVRRLLKYVLFVTFFGSMFFAYIEQLSHAGFDLGGGVGHAIIHGLHAYVGYVGVAFLLLFIVVLFFVLNYGAEVRASKLIEKLRHTRLPSISLSRHVSATATTTSTTSSPKGPKNRNRPISALRQKLGEETAPTDNSRETTRPELSLRPQERPVKAVVPTDANEIELEITSPTEEKPRITRTKDEPEFTIIDPTIDQGTGLPERRQLEQIGEDNIGQDEEGNVEKIIPEADQEIDNPDDFLELEHYDPTQELSDYEVPPFELLDDHGAGRNREVNREELEENKNKIVKTLEDYGIKINSIKATIGPTVTLYEIVPAPGVRISKIKNLEDDIALSLAALGIRIIAPIPGKGTIGIEVPNSKQEIVSLRGVLTTEKFLTSKAELPIALGRTISNEVYIADLNRMPHLLIAGATGQGKSVGLNTIIASLLYKKHPAEVKFVLIDPKKVEMNPYQALKYHFLAQLPDQGEEPIITDVHDAVRVLKSLCVEMDMRYDLLKLARVRNLKEYNQKFINRKLNPRKGHQYLPYIVLIIDELADMMMVAGKEVEMPIARLAQLARAVGIHLCVATQRPSVNVITGIIKANFPARLSYRVISKVDSRTILDANGADQLIGRGDLLLSTGSDLIRIQNAFIDTPEVERIVEHIAQQHGFPEPYFLPELPTEDDDELEDDEPFERDNRFDEAARLIVRYQIGSASLIQRKMKLGYNRAGRIIDQLEKAKIVGPHSGSKARDVLIQDESELERYLNDL